MPEPTPNPLVRKLGPLPVWGWAALAVSAWFLFFRGGGAAASTDGGLPYTPRQGAGSAAQQPASGQGGADENTNADLLAALGQNASANDALLAAVQSTSPYASTQGGGGSGYTSGGSNAAPSSLAQGEAAEPPADPVPPFDPSQSTAEQTYYVVPSASPAEAPTYFAPTGYFQNEQGLATVTTPPQLAPGELVKPGTAVAV